MEKSPAKLPDAVAGFVEAELRAYPARKTGLEWLEREYESLVGEWPAADGVTRCRLMVLEDRLRERRDRVRRVEAGLSQLTPDERELVRAKYFGGGEPVNAELMAALGFSRKRFYGLRRAVLSKFARIWGLEL